LLIVAAMLAGCTVAHERSVRAPSAAPSLAAVHGDRFVSVVDLDDGGLVVDPAGKAKPLVSSAAAATMFRASVAVDGSYAFSMVGLGFVTVSNDVPTPPVTGTTGAIGATGTTSTTGTTGTTGTTSTTSTTGTTRTTTTTGAGTTGTTSTTGAGAVAGTTTSVASTTLPVPGGVTQEALPVYDHRLAWVGVAWNTCPGAATGTVGSTLGPAGTPTRYTVVVFDADTGHDALAYTSGGVSACGAAVQAPVVSRPAELVSVAWQPVGTGSTAVQVSLPACGTFYGWTALQPTGAIEVVASVPYDPDCGDAAGTQTVDDVVPLGRAQAGVAHAPLGLVDAERSLPTG